MAEIKLLFKTMYKCTSLHQHTFTQPLQTETVSTGLALFNMRSIFSHTTPHGGHGGNVSAVCKKNSFTSVADQ